MATLKGTFLFCLVFGFCFTPAQAQYLRIYYPDIEQGASTLVVAPTGNALLIDGGSGLNSSDTPIEGFINDLIDAGIVTSLDYIVATHYDEDHIGRLENVYQYVPISPTLTTYDRGTFNVPGTFAYADYAFQADQTNRVTVTPNTAIALGGGVTVRCYVVNGQLPDGSSVDLTGAPQFENATGAAFAVHYGDVDVWIGGDLVGNTSNGHPAVEQAVAPFVGDVDIYTVDHHGSDVTSSDGSFLAAIKAEFAINQNSVQNGHGHPNLNVVNRFKATSDTFGNTPIWFQTNPGKPGDTRSDDSLADGIADPDDITEINGKPGTITVISDGGSYQIYGGAIEPTSSLADSGTHVLADFPPAILETDYAPLVPLAAESVTVSAQLRDEGAITATIQYQLNGNTQPAIAMTDMGGGLFRGILPAQTDGSKVSFRVVATDSALQSTPSAATGYFSGTTPIATLREQDAQGILLTRGYSARVVGNITAEPGLFHPTVSQIYVQDATGGLNIFDSSIGAIQRGDLVEFVGEVEQFGGIAELIIAEPVGNYGFTVLSSPASPPAPTVITLSQLNETTEGLLIRINNLTISSGTIPETGNASLLVTDDGGTTLRTLRVDGDTDIPGANTPLLSFDLIGIATQFDSTVPLDFGYQITPRERADFFSAEVNHPVILIAEIHADPDASLGDANGDGTVSTSQDEFVEIVNTSFNAIDISGYTIADAVSTRFTFPAGSILPAREAAVVFAGGTPTGDFGNAAANGLVFTAGTLGLNNSGDTITLGDNLGDPVHVVVYGSEGGQNEALVRDPDYTNAPLVKHTTTSAGLRYSPGARNNGDPYTLMAGDLLLSEVVYDPSGSDSGSEWVELINVSSRTIDLSEVSLGGGGGDYTSTKTQLAGSIAPGETFVVGGPISDGDNASPSFDQVFSFSPGFQNSGATADGVALFNLKASLVTGSTVPIDAVVYGTTNSSNLIDETGVANVPEVGDAPSGFSIERTDLAGSWQIQALPTPNTSPVLEPPPPMGVPTDIILTEVYYDYTGPSGTGDDDNEWVEIHNTGDLPVSLTGMSIGSGGGTYTKSTVQLGGTIPAGETWVIGGPNSDSGNGNPLYDLVFDFNPDIQNSGSVADAVALFDVPAASITDLVTPIDAVIFGGANSDGLIDETGVANAPEVGDAPAGSSIERINLAGDWQIQAAPDPNNITFSTNPCSGIAIETTISIPIAGGEVDIRYGTQNLVDGDIITGDEGDTIQWRLHVNGFNGPWQSFGFSCASPELAVTTDDYCDLAVVNPVAGAVVDIRYGAQNLADGDTYALPAGINIQWRFSVNGFDGGWISQTVGGSGCAITVRAAHYCDLEIDNPVPGAVIDIRYGPQNLADGDRVTLPHGKNIQWRLSVTGFDGSWITHTVDSNSCILSVDSSHYCEVDIEIPVAGTVDIRYGPQDLVDGDSLFLPQGKNVQWRVNLSGFDGPWRTHTVGSMGCVIAVTSVDYCNTAISIPPAGGQLDIRYGPQNLVDGDSVLLPQGINAQWRLSLNGFNSGWKTHQVGSSGCAIAVSGSDYCDVTISIPPAGGQLDIRYGPQNLVNGDSVLLPQGINVQWRLSLNGFNSGWHTHNVGSAGCAITVAASNYCDTAINIPVGSALLDIRYGPQDLSDGATLLLPQGINVQWRLWVNGFNGPWRTHAVGSAGCAINPDGNDYCNLEIQLPESSLLDIRYGPQNLANGTVVDLPRDINIQYRLDSGPWITHAVGSGGCVLDAN